MIMTKKNPKPRCPDAKTGWYSDMDICTLNSKLCVLESGEKCPYYEEWLKEENNEYGTR